MESLFEFLFKYRLGLFRQGDLVLRAAWPVATLLIAVAAVAAVVGFSYLRPRGRAGALDRSIMAVLRTCALGVIVLCLLQPTLVLRAVVPQRNFVGILVDDSHSMTLPGEDGRPRGDFIADQLTPDGALMTALTERFAVRTFADLVHRSVADYGGFDELGIVVPHQMNIRIIEAAAERLELSIDLFYSNLEKYGNTSAASVPIAMREARDEGRFEAVKGKLACMCAFGSGLGFGHFLLRV